MGFDINIGFIGILTIVFVILKSFNKFPFSWWIVFLPIWGSLLLSVLIIIITLICIIIKELLD
jgi:hypothetical protein